MIIDKVFQLIIPGLKEIEGNLWKEVEVAKQIRGRAIMKSDVGTSFSLYRHDGAVRIQKDFAL